MKIFLRIKRGFTLVEILIVVSILILLASLSIPKLLRARLNANESAAISTLKAVISACEGYRISTISFPPNLATLSTAVPPYIADVITNAVNPATARQGYFYTYAPGLAVGGLVSTYHVYACPAAAATTGVRGFYVDEQGIICWITPATPADPGHAPPGAGCPVGWNPVQ